MTKAFSLTPNPTFTATVKFPVAGGDTASLKIDYRHKTATELDDYFKRIQKMTDLEAAMEVVSGWELSEEFSRENVEKLFQNYVGSARAVLQSYVSELMGAREGN